MVAIKNKFQEGNIVSKAKKLICSLFSLALFACSTNDLNSQSLQQDQSVESFSRTKQNGKLPQLPSNPVFAAFSNDYKGLVSENNKIAREDPNNPDKYLFSLIQSAKNTLDAAIYDIDDPGVTNEFIQAAKRGVKVRIVTDTDSMKSLENPALPRQAIEDLKAAGIPVVDDKRSGLMHNKFIIVDNFKVWTGSYNLSTADMYLFNQNIVLINSTELAENFNAEFNRFFQGTFNNKPTLQLPNPIVNVGDAAIKTYFSPNGGTLQAILNALQTATKVKFMAFSFTSTDIANQFIAISKKPGGQVEGVYDGCQSSNSYERVILSNLKQNKISIYPDGNQALLHHKVMILDDSTVITGSFNFSKNAEATNNENTLIIKSPSIAKLFLDEYDRVKQSALNAKNSPLPHYDHPACGSSGSGHKNNF